ncbi:hypothetical protein JOM56_000003 [Amanita muscaria]
MAPIRITSTLQRRRRSSLALNPFIPPKAGLYTIHRPVTFAPNITPGTFVDPEEDDPTTASLSTLFPPSDNTVPCSLSTTRKRCPPGKRRSQGYIPRPPNAFMLFRADFVRQKHVPGSIETNHGSLSKIIGNCWRALPLEEKRIWEIKAKHAKAEHKARYPDYRFRPVHNKNKDNGLKKKEKSHPTLEDEQRCEQVAQFLLEGKKGDELAAAIKNLERLRSQIPADYTAASSLAAILPRRPSSVPLPSDYLPSYFTNIALPSLPQMHFSPSRPSSPLSISHHQRRLLGERRPSSAGPTFTSRSWTFPTMGAEHIFHQDVPTPLPVPDTSLFNDAWSSSFPTSAPTPSPSVVEDNSALFNYEMMMPQEFQAPVPIHHHTVGPLDPTTVPSLDMSWIQMGLDASSQLDSSISNPSSVYLGSPEPADDMLLASHQLAFHDSYPTQSYNAIGADFGAHPGYCTSTTTTDLNGMNGMFAAFPTFNDDPTLNHHDAFYDLNAIVASE